MSYNYINDKNISVQYINIAKHKKQLLKEKYTEILNEIINNKALCPYVTNYYSYEKFSSVFTDQELTQLVDNTDLLQQFLVQKICKNQFLFLPQNKSLNLNLNMNSNNKNVQRKKRNFDNVNINENTNDLKYPETDIIWDPIYETEGNNNI